MSPRNTDYVTLRALKVYKDPTASTDAKILATAWLSKHGKLPK